MDAFAPSKRWGRREARGDSLYPPVGGRGVFRLFGRLISIRNARARARVDGRGGGVSFGRGTQCGSGTNLGRGVAAKSWFKFAYYGLT